MGALGAAALTCSISGGVNGCSVTMRRETGCLGMGGRTLFYDTRRFGRFDRTRIVVDQHQRRTGFEEVDLLFTDQAPRLNDLQEISPWDDIVELRHAIERIDLVGLVQVPK